MAKCSDGSLYTGVTTDIRRRMNEHNAKRGARYTRGRTPVILIHDESRSGRSEALRREAEIKSWPRSRKLILIKSGGKKIARSPDNN